MTGVRDAVIYEKAVREGKVTGFFDGWAADPYDQECKRPYLMNLSERREFDAAFPGHPLTLARKLVAEVTEVVVG